MQNYDLLIERIAKASGLEKSDIEKRVNDKKTKLSGLISKEGAAQIIAAELGINFDDQELKIVELMHGMRKVNVTGKVINIFPVREYEKNGRTGKVVNLVLADETGNCRVVLWDTNHISLVETEEIKTNMVVEIKNASTRDNEIHLSGFSEIKTVDKIIENVQTAKKTNEKTLDKATNGDSIRARGIIVQIFPIRFYNVCPQCNKKVSELNNYECTEHGKVIPQKRGILNMVIDDGTESIRAVMFGENINKLQNENELEDLQKFEDFKNKLIGTEVYVEGNIRRNTLFNNLELIITNIEIVNVEELIKILEK